MPWLVLPLPSLLPATLIAITISLATLAIFVAAVIIHCTLSLFVVACHRGCVCVVFDALLPATACL
jgi:hypothetical protein